MGDDDEIIDYPRALHSREVCYVRFINTIDREVMILWINYYGEYMQYKILKRSEYVDVNTYKTHPWIVKDLETKDRYQINGEYFYRPKTSREIMEEKYPDLRVPQNYEVRARAFISLPLYSLRYASLLVLRNCLSKEEDVDQLILPKNLSEELKKSIVQQHKEIL